MRKLILAAAFAAMAAPAAAQACTEDEVNALTDEFYATLDENGTTEAQLEQYFIEIENHYGGEPSDEQTCEAIQMMIDMAEADG